MSQHNETSSKESYASVARKGVDNSSACVVYLDELNSLNCQLDLTLGCFQCFQRKNDGLYHRVLNDCHECAEDFLLAKEKCTKNVWKNIRVCPPLSVVFVLCKFSPDGEPCKYRNCNFASCKEEEIIWNFETAHDHSRAQIKSSIKKVPYHELSAADNFLLEFGGKFQFLCHTCCLQDPPTFSTKSQNQEVCTSQQKHEWHPLLVHMVIESNDENGIHYQPIREFREHNEQGLCRHRNTCHQTDTNCKWSHSVVELSFWFKAQHLAHFDKSLVERSEQKYGNYIIPLKEFQCKLCLVTCTSQEEFRQHCASLSHHKRRSQTNENWKFKEPPENEGDLKVCPCLPEDCKYKTSCCCAHSKEELEEWIQRFTFQQKGNEGKNAYILNIIDEYHSSEHGYDVLNETVEDATVHCTEELEIYTQKRGNHKWKFEVTSIGQPCSTIALLKTGKEFSLNRDRSVYEETKTQPMFPSVGTSHKYVRSIEVYFSSKIYGVFNQWVMFEFGKRPFLVQKIRVTVTDKIPMDEKEKEKPSLSSNWDLSTMEIVRSSVHLNIDHELLLRYKSPEMAFDFTNPYQEFLPTSLNAQNYRTTMHNFLYQEEQCQKNTMERMKMCVNVDMKKHITTKQAFHCAKPGQCFGQFAAPKQLDSDGKDILLHNVNTALVGLEGSLHTVYEVFVLKETLSDEQVCVIFPESVIKSLNISESMQYKMEIQFQVDRVHFCRMHYAVDNVKLQVIVPRNQENSYNQNLTFHGTNNLNEKQRKVLAYTMQGNTIRNQVSPLLLCGPFGTGKTFTLNSALVEILRERHTNVLLCTHTNSAADLYIQEYKSELTQWKPLRVYYENRRINTVDPNVRQFCLISKSQQFVYPTKQQVENYRVIITTFSTAYILHKRAPDVHFTHILLDEAAQALECETLIPLLMADENTKVVVAGDHFQIAPKLFTKKFVFCFQSLIHRLFVHYGQMSFNTIVLHENYRSVHEITNFLVNNIYGVKYSGRIKSVADDLKHDSMYPLAFCHVEGECKKGLITSSWRNVTEAEHVVQKVQALLQSWPPQWEQEKEKHIAVLCDDYEQVLILRDLFRSKKLEKICVDSINNIQGKQFRAIFISTVRRDANTTNGFFSDSCFLNTAMSRARSLISVVGDALALCSTGKCNRVWEMFLNECIQNQSLTSTDLSVEDIKQKIMIEQQKTSAQTAGNSNGSQDCLNDEERSDLILDALLIEIFQNEPQGSDENNQVCTERIFQQVTEEGMVELACHRRETDQDPHEPSYAKRDKFRKYEVHSPEKLKEMLSKEPETYKRCQLWMKSHECGIACPVDGTSEIAVNGRINCGSAFPGEEVVVRITEKQEDDLHGKVIGITKRETGKLKNIICYIDSYDCKIMIPINRLMVKIHNLNKMNKPQNHICIWDVNSSYSKPIVNRLQSVPISNRRNKLFTVKYLKWLPHCIYPLGIVTEEIQLGNNKPNGMNVLQIQYELNGKEFPCTKSIQHPSQEGRKDYTKDYVFTIDDEVCKDIDDAISVRELDDQYEIGIHIADVSAFVQKGGDVDVEARNRATSFYSPCHKGEPIHMLPKELSELYCSLMPDSVRCTFAVLFSVDKINFKIIEKPTVERTVIISKCSFTYKEAADLLDQTPKVLNATSFEGCMNVAATFADCLRKERLKEGWHLVSLFNTIHSEHRPRGMIEELMILANRTVAEILLGNETTKNLIPLRIQPKPKSSKMSYFRDVVKPILPISPYLRSCMEHTMSDGNQPSSSTSLKKVFILEPVWTKLIEFQKCKNFDKMKALLHCEKLHPQLAAALETEKLFGKKAYMVRAGVRLGDDANHHFRLRLEAYTWFTSPIRRYMDIVVHRLLETVVLNKSEAPYTTEEIDDICRHFNLKTEDSKKYESQSELLVEADDLKKNPRQQLAVLFNIQEGKSKLSILFLDQRFENMNSFLLSFGLLGLDQQPEFKDDSLTLKWKRRFFCPNKGDIFSSGVTVLDTAAHSVSIQTENWIALQKAISKNDYTRVTKLVETENQTQNNARFQQSVKSRKWIQKQPEQDINTYQLLSMTLKNGSVIKMQQGPTMYRGLLKPNIQVVYLNKQIDICIEHVRDPELCFTETNCGEVKGVNFHNIEKYIERWIPVTKIEAAVNSVMQHDPMVFLNVETCWNEDSPSSGSFKIDSSYTDIGKLEKVITAGDLVCIRHSYALNESKEKSALLVDINPNESTWVAHCVITASKKVPAYIEVTFQLHQCASEPPPHIYVSKQPSTVEIILQNVPDKRKMDAIESLKGKANLARRIALKDISLNPEMRINPEYRTVWNTPGLPELNQPQSKAVMTALNSKFSIIQGPPGTGKTITGAHIVLNYFKHNQIHRAQPIKSKRSRSVIGFTIRGNEPWQILYCGPSNKSVDVVAEILLKAKCDLSILRVYGEQIEQLAFPLEDVPISKETKRDAGIKSCLKSIALHYKIRQSQTNPDAEQIETLYNELKKKKLSPSEARVKTSKYKELVRKAQIEEIRKHHVILCTCTTAARPLLKDNTSIFLCIVDESGMCTEPESLIPIVSSDAKRVVLIGDHKQLRPIVKSQLAEDLGLGISMFERYASDALMLNIQYRMHQDICSFPSKEFYGGKLKTAEVVLQQAPGIQKHPHKKNCPIMFCHIEGKDTFLYVMSEEGNEKSRANITEVTYAVSYAEDLIRKGRATEEEVAIITPYNAQVTEIKKALKQKCLKNVRASTVVRSQGCEWNYVILSTVRSLPLSEIEDQPNMSWLRKNLGSLTDANQLNVAITRAKKGLCIIGNKNLLKCHVQWRKLLQHYKEKNCIWNAENYSPV